MNRLVQELKEAGADYEFYPTTIHAVLGDISTWMDWRSTITSVLDIGAGDGKVLCVFADWREELKLYAIGKAPPSDRAPGYRCHGHWHGLP